MKHFIERGRKCIVKVDPCLALLVLRSRGGRSGGASVAAAVGFWGAVVGTSIGSVDDTVGADEPSILDGEFAFPVIEVVRWVRPCSAVALCGGGLRVNFKWKGAGYALILASVHLRLFGRVFNSV